MYLKKITVENFRMLKNIEVPFFETDTEELTLIVGKNNSGKTSILRILEKMIPKTIDGSFQWDDFTMKYQEEIFSGINNFKEINDEVMSFEIKLTIVIGYTEEDSYDVIRPFMMDLKEDNQTITIECNYRIKEDQIIKVQEKLLELDIKTFKNFAPYMRKNFKKFFKFEYYTVSQCGQYKEEIGRDDLGKIIRLKRIKANRDISDRQSDHSLSKISDRFYNLVEKEETDEYKKFQLEINKMDKSLTKNYSDIFKDVLRTVKRFGVPSDLDIEILSTIKEKDLLRENTTLFYNKDSIYLPESYNGLGYLNLIGMIFEVEAIAEEFEKLNLESEALNLLFIEEPEAHTHPQLQYIFIRKIKELLKKHLNKNIQTIITTHSAHIVSECDFEDIVYLTRESNYTIVKSFKELRYSEDYQSFEFVKKYLHLTRAELFFADKAILIEGDTERILMRSMMSKVDEKNSLNNNELPLSSQNISIIEVGAHAHIFKNLFKFLDIKTLIITDLDYGKEKETKDKKNTRINKCDYSEATHITNATITKFLKKETIDLEDIINYKFDDKVRGKCRIAYQTKEDGISNDYPGRSFEEAFININFEFLEKNIDSLKSFKNKKNFNTNCSPYYLADKCIEKKSTFAVDLLYYDDNWKVPKYIEEGLEWLRK